MIAKAVKGRGFRGALAYDLGKDEGQILDTNMAGEGVNELASEFGAIRKLRPNLEKAVLHVSLSAAPGENLSDAQWEEIGRRYLDGMDFVDNQYLITRHTDTEHEHIHILANRITHSGQVVSDSQDYQRQEVLMRSIERDFGLQQLAPSLESQRRAPTRGEIEKQIRTQDASTRVQLQQLADAAAKGATSYTEYQQRLEAAGVELVPVLQKDGAKLSGLMYRLDGVTMKGSDLGKGYSPAGLAKRGVSYEQGRDAEAVRNREEQDQPRAAGRAGPDDPRRQGAERGGAKRDARAAGQGTGLAQQRRGQDLGPDRGGDPDGGRELRAPGQGRQRQPGGGDPGHQPGDDRPAESGRRPGLEALRPDRGDRTPDGGARQRVLALVQAADHRQPPGSEYGGGVPQAGDDRGDEDRQGTGQAGKEQVAAASLAWAAELARLERERDERVRRVLAQAEQRQARREQALQRLVQARPEAPQGFVATLQRKGHEPALLAWEAAKEAATKLVEQARRLAVRLLEATRPERLVAWASLKRGQPANEASRRALAVVAKQPRKPRPPQPSRLPQLPDVSRSSIEDQYRVYRQMIDQLKVVGQEKVQRVAAKVAKRLERRQTRAVWSQADQPPKPHGLLAAFKKREYDEAVKVYWKRLRHDRTLVEQATKLQTKVQEASYHSAFWAVGKLRTMHPEFTRRVKRYIDQQVRMAEQEAQRKLQQERGIDGPQMTR